MRFWYPAALVFSAATASAQTPPSPPPPAAPAEQPICAFGQDAAAYRQEAYCSAQVALRSGIARSFALLSARMAATDDKLGLALRRMQDADARVDLLIQAERAARADAAAKDRLASARERLDTAIGERDAARVALETAYPQWTALTRPSPISEQQTRALLKPGETMIFWLVGDDQTFAFAIDRDRASWQRIAVGRAALERSILGLREALGVAGRVRGAVAMHSDNQDAATFRARAAALQAQLFPSSIGTAARRAGTLLLVPSGPLIALPFAALPTGTGRDPRWLGLQKPIALLPSPADLRTLRARPPVADVRTPFAGFGAPRLTAAAVAANPASRGSALRAAIADLPALPEAAAELRSLAAAVGAPATSVRTGTDATERAVKTADLAKARIVAFATHGLIAGEIDGVDEGALVLTPPGAPDAIDDGLLTASEAAQLHLDADWVLLSACSTAAGDRVGGEALSGLAAAFGYAGARALLVSHWQVRDDAARRLTTLAVTNRALGRGEAVRRAMRDIATDRRHPEWHDPAIWAVMTLIGDPAR